MNDANDFSLYQKVLSETICTPEETFSELMNFVFAGNQTLSKAICTAMYVLSQNEEVVNKLRAEIKQEL